MSRICRSNLWVNVGYRESDITDIRHIRHNFSGPLRCRICRILLYIIIRKNIFIYAGTSHLDLFTHSLLVKCNSPEYLDRLLETLINVIQSQHSPGRSREGVIVAKRFLRSVIRVFVVISAQSAPDKLGASISNYTYSTYSQPLSKCRRAFMVCV